MFRKAIKIIFVLLVVLFIAAFIFGKNTVPNLVGMNLEDADDEYSISARDMISDRTIMWSENWKICAQDIPSGGEVDNFHSIGVEVVKNNENCPGEISPTPTPKYTPKPVDTSWAKGYDYIWNGSLAGGLAWEWTKSGGDCYGDYCWRIKIISRDGCPNGVYAEINIEENGVVIDYTNDSLNYLAPKKSAVMVFNEFGDNPNVVGDLVRLECR